MKKLNILMLGSSYKMGLTYYLALYSAGLKQIGHDVTVLSSRGEQTNGLLNELKEKDIQLYESAFIDGKNPYATYKAAKEIVSILISGNINVVHVNGFHHMFKCYLALKLANLKNKVPIIFMVHSIRHGTKYEKSTCLIGSRLMNMCCDMVMPVSEWERLRLIRSGLNPDKAITVHNAIDFNKFDSDVSNQRSIEMAGIDKDIFLHKTVAYLAQLIPRKGIGYLLQSVPQVLKVFPDVKFLVMGEGPLKSNLKEMCTSLNIAENVCFTGRVKNKYVPNILSRADIAVISSLSETFGHNIIEPMAAGKPVVSTPVGVAPEIIENGETGFIVPQKDPDALAEAIIKLLKNREGRGKMGMNARTLVERKFNLNTISKKFTKAYNSALQKAGNN